MQQPTTPTAACTRPILTALAAAMLAAMPLAGAPAAAAAAQDARSGAGPFSMSGADALPSGADFAAAFDWRLRDPAASADATTTAQNVRPPYDPAYDDDDERGEGGAEGDRADPSRADAGEPSATDANAGQRGGEAQRDTGPAPTTSSAPAAARGCGERTARRIARMLDRMQLLTEPTGAQQQAFEKLREAAERGLDIARSACPTERPLTPTGRLAAAEKRLESLLQAIRTVQPALDDFFKTLTEEQKARFYAAVPPRRGEPMRERARRSLGDGRLDAWRDEMRRRWRERWSDDEGTRPRPERRWRERDDWRRGDDWRGEGRRGESWRGEGWRGHGGEDWHRHGDGARRGEREAPPRSRHSDGDGDDDVLESFDL